MRLYQKLRALAVMHLFLFAMPAYAYIDPGTGAMLVQSFLALIATVVFYIKNPSQLLEEIKNFIKQRWK